MGNSEEHINYVNLFTQVNTLDGAILMLRNKYEC